MGALDDLAGKLTPSGGLDRLLVKLSTVKTHTRVVRGRLETVRTYDNSVQKKVQDAAKAASTGVQATSGVHTFRPTTAAANEADTAAAKLSKKLAAKAKKDADPKVIAQRQKEAKDAADAAAESERVASVARIAKGWAERPVPKSIIEAVEAEKTSSALRNWDRRVKDFTPERKRLHEAYISESLKGVTPEAEKKYTMMGGGPASGKSSIIKQRKGTKDALDKNRVVVNADIAKMGGADEGKPNIPGIPDFQEQIRSGKLQSAAGFVHEESSAMAKKLNMAALESGLSVLNDGVGDGKVEDVLGKIAEARSAGYKVEGVYVSADTSDALVRAVVRGYEQERYVNPAIVYGGHSKVSKIFTGLANHADGFDNIELWDTDENPPVKVAQGSRGALDVLDKDRFQKFLDKADQSYEQALEAAIALAHSKAGMSDDDLLKASPTKRAPQLKEHRQHLQKAVADLQDVLSAHRQQMAAKSVA